MSTDLPTLAVTGSTGGLGGRVARRLAASDVAQRLLVRDPSRAPVLDGATPVAIKDYDDHDSVLEALRGVTTLFMVSAAENADRLGQHYTFVDAAAEAGVRHVIYTSFSGAAEDATFTLGRAPLLHRGADQGVRDGLDVPARQPLPRRLPATSSARTASSAGPLGRHGRGRHPRGRLRCSSGDPQRARRPCRLHLRADRPRGAHPAPDRGDHRARAGARGHASTTRPSRRPTSRAASGRRPTGRTTPG